MYVYRVVAVLLHRYLPTVVSAKLLFVVVVVAASAAALSPGSDVCARARQLRCEIGRLIFYTHEVCVLANGGHYVAGMITAVG